MASGVIFMRWDSYEDANGKAVFFSPEPLSFNSRQDRLHKLSRGDRLWIVSRCPSDQQYYFIALLTVSDLRSNNVKSEDAQFGEFGVIADRTLSRDLGKQFPAESLLRALEFDPNKPIKYGASIG